jgi:hypothetical protein
MACPISSAAAAAVVVPQSASFWNHQLGTIKSTYSDHHTQKAASSWSSSLSQASSHIYEKRLPRGLSTSSLLISTFFTSSGRGGGTTYREDDVSTSGRTADVCTRVRSKKASELQSKEDDLSESGSSTVSTIDQNLEAPLPSPSDDANADGDEDGDLTTGEGVTERGEEDETSLGTMAETLTAFAQQNENKPQEITNRQDAALPTMQDIVARAAQEGVKLQVRTFGPTFQITVSNMDESTVFGKADGFIKWWWPKGKILHLESVKLQRGLSKQVGNVFGAGFFVGAATLRYGLDEGCRTAELLAIYDDEMSHEKVSFLLSVLRPSSIAWSNGSLLSHSKTMLLFVIKSIKSSKFMWMVSCQINGILICSFKAKRIG